MTSGISQTPRALAADQARSHEPGGVAGRSPEGPLAVTTVVLLATVPSEDGRAAAALPWNGGTVLGRLLAQLAEIGVRSAHVVTRTDWERELQPSLEDTGLSARLHPSTGIAEDLRTVAEIAGSEGGGLLVAAGDVVTQREALAPLLEDPRPATEILGTTRSIERALAFPVRESGNRLVSSASPYHAVHEPNMTFLGVLKVAGANRASLADVAGRLADLAEPPLPPAWEDELRSKEGTLGREAAADTASLLLVGLVRSGVHVGTRSLRELFWGRPRSRAATARAAGEIAAYDEDRARLESAVKENDGFFTTFFVSPYSKYIARWAARRGLTPNQVTVISLGIGVLAAVAFGTGERAGLIAGALLLQLSFTTDCVDGQLARYTRTFSRFGAWLDAIFDRAKEYAVYGGLAIGASSTGDPVWVLAGSALALQTVRHAIDFSYPTPEQRVLSPARRLPLEEASDRGPHLSHASEAGAAPARLGLAGHPAFGWIKKIAGFPIGERFAAISVTAAVAGARTTFVVLLAWGGLAAAYQLAGRLLRSVR